MTSELIWRLGAFGSVFACCWFAERRWPRDTVPADRRRARVANLALGGLNAVAMRVLVPWLAVDAAVWAAQHEVGLLHRVAAPDWLVFVAGFLALDLLVFVQHVALHRSPQLWRLHAVHHSEWHLDVTAGLRFHPLEILLSMLLKIVAVLVLGISPTTIISFEIALNAMALWTHSNLQLSRPLELALRWLLVTPSIHRIHHSALLPEQLSNFGNGLSCWDRALGTWRPRSAVGVGFPLGLPASSPELRAESGVVDLLKRPFT